MEKINIFTRRLAGIRYQNITKNNVIYRNKAKYVKKVSVEYTNEAVKSFTEE